MLNKINKYLSIGTFIETTAWDLTEKNLTVYIPVVKKDTGKYGVFVEIEDDCRILKAFAIEEEALKYRLSNEKQNVRLLKLTVDKLFKQLSFYLEEKSKKIECHIHTYDRDGNLYKLYIVWANKNN